MSKTDLDLAYKIIDNIRKSMALRLVGQTRLVDALLIGLITNGHILVEGAPGLAKTLAIKTLSDVAGLDFKRIQFTPDLLPSDIVGTMVYNQTTSSFTTKKGPLFAHLILADEINRAPAKVQSALLEAMAERQVTIGDVSHPLPKPFFVMATQNSLEQEGTYPLPEAQLDRFLMKVILDYPSPQEELEILQLMGKDENIETVKILSIDDINMLRNMTNQIKVDESIEKYIVSIVVASRTKDSRLLFSPYIQYGASPRATLALYKVAKARALLNQRDFVIPDDVKTVAYDVLRHRLVLSYEAEAADLSVNDVIEQLLSAVAVP